MQGASGTGRFQHAQGAERRTRYSAPPALRGGTRYRASRTGRFQHLCAGMRTSPVQGASGTGRLHSTSALTCAEAWYRAPPVPDGSSMPRALSAGPGTGRLRHFEEGPGTGPSVPDGSSTWALACAQARYRARLRYWTVPALLGTERMDRYRAPPVPDGSSIGVRAYGPVQGAPPVPDGSSIGVRAYGPVQGAPPVPDHYSTRALSAWPGTGRLRYRTVAALKSKFLLIGGSCAQWMYVICVAAGHLGYVVQPLAVTRMQMCNLTSMQLVCSL